MPSFSFNAQDVDLAEDRPAAASTTTRCPRAYAAMVIESGYEANSKGNGHFIKLVGHYRRGAMIATSLLSTTSTTQARPHARCATRLSCDLPCNGPRGFRQD